MLLRSQIKYAAAFENIETKVTTPFTCRDVAWSLKESLGVVMDHQHIRKIMMTKLNLTYKKGAPRPIDLDISRQRWCEALFSILMIKAINRFDVLINVDESTISKSMRNEYSWSSKGTKNVLCNTSYPKSILMISAITTEGWVFTRWSNSRTNSEVFVDYINDLILYLSKHSKWPLEKMLLILDNARYHTSKATARWLEESAISVIYLPAYAPAL